MVRHLPTTIKYLLTLRNPDSFASPPLTNLHAIFRKTSQEATQKKAETGWLVLTVRSVCPRPFNLFENNPQTCTLLTLNCPSSVGHLYRFVTRVDPGKTESRKSTAHAVNTAAVMREAALKSTIFVGVPRVSEFRTGFVRQRGISLGAMGQRGGLTFQREPYPWRGASPFSRKL
jgi:hypothetical protein